ncbi:hypothetical protein KKG65_02520 [Patescibacteria group bacterium]|nr:hypothetical protein [Patescibacteria group bacterium]
MVKIKDLPKVDRPREKFLIKGADALSKSELLAILIGSGIKGKNVKKLSQQIIRKFGDKFLELTVDNLLEVQGIGKAKALQIASAIALTKRFNDERGSGENLVLSSKDATLLNSDLKDKSRMKDMTIADLFAGVGGIKIGFEQAGYQKGFTDKRNVSIISTL